MNSGRGSGLLSLACIWVWILLLPTCYSVAVGAPGPAAGSQDSQTGSQLLSLAPDRIVIDAELGSANPMVFRDITVSDAVGGTALAYTATVQSGSDWLLVGNAVSGLTISKGLSVSSTTPGDVRVFASYGALSAGIHYGTISISLASAPGDPVLLPVTLNLRNHPTLILRPRVLKFSSQGNYRFSHPQPQTMSVFGDATKFSVLISTDSGGNWLSVSPSSATTPADLTVSVNVTGLASGIYQGTITFVAQDSSNSGLSAEVILTVTDSPSPTVTPDSISLQAQYGSHQQVSQSLSVATNGDSIYVTPSTGSEPWISVETVDPWAGAKDGGTNMVLPKPAKLRVSANPAGLPVGTYSSSVTVGDKTVPVTLQINPNDLILPQVADGDGWKTVITLVNTDSGPAPYTLRFWQPDGDPLTLQLDGIGEVSEYTDTIPAGGSRRLQTAGVDAAVSQGWAEIIAQGSIGGTAVFSQSNLNGESEAAVSVAPPQGNYLLLPYDNTEGYQTGLSVVNTGTEQATIAFDLRDEEGNQIASDEIPLSGHGSRAMLLPAQYPSLANRRGLIRIDSSVSKMSVMGLRFSPGGSFTSFQPVGPQGQSKDTVTRTVSQVADGSGWRTTFVLVNPGTKPAPFSIVFRDPVDGSPLTVPLMAVGASGEYSDVIPAGGVRTFQTEGVPDALVEGWAEIVSPSPLGGTVVFGLGIGGGYDSEAAVQIGPPIGERFVVPFNNADGFVTALALLNDSRDNNYLATVTLRDEDGQRLTTEYLQIDAYTSQTFMLSDYYPSSSDVRGTIEFSGAQVSALGLLFNPFGTFTSVTPISK